MELELGNGKYKITREGARLIAYRYGERWRDITGDNIIFYLLEEIERLKDNNLSGRLLVDALNKVGTEINAKDCPICKVRAGIEYDFKETKGIKIRFYRCAYCSTEWTE